MSLSVDFTHRFGDFSMDVSFDAPEGITVLFGRSGSGKTNIIKCVSGLVNPDQGHIASNGVVLFDSRNKIRQPPHKRRIGYVFQEDRLFPHLTVAQNLNYGRRFAAPGPNKKDIDQIAELLGLQNLLSRKPALLSGGEKQRVAIGRALLSDPQLILADEPLAALDAARKEEILPYFEHLRDYVNVPILYVTHSAAEVSRLATTVVALEAGRVVRQGPAADVLSDPQVTPLGAGAAGAFLNATVKLHHDDGISELDAQGMPLLLPGVSYPVGTRLRVRIEAQDIMIALDPPVGVSALNILPATITAVRMGDGPGALVQLKTGENTLLARITRRSADALSLQAGKQVFAVIKAVSVPREAIGDRSTTTQQVG